MRSILCRTARVYRALTFQHLTHPKYQVPIITNPKAIRYQANTLKSWPLTYRINARTANAALTKEATDPTPMTARSSNCREWRALNSSSTVAPNIVGIARKNENSVAAGRDRPRSRPPMMVAPEREVPGIMDNTWATPIQIASAGLTASTLSMRAVRLRLSIQRMRIPPTMNAVATGTGANRYFLMVFMNITPITAAGRNASTRFSVKRCDFASPGSVGTTLHN